MTIADYARELATQAPRITDAQALEAARVLAGGAR